MVNSDHKQNIDWLPHKLHFMRVAAGCTNNQFTIDDQNRELVGDLFMYFMNLPGKYDLRKGLWLEGPVGTGKSTIMNAFSKFMISYNRGFRIYICGAIITEYALTGDLDKYLENQNGYLHGPVEMCFDELGRESTASGYYTTKLNVMQHILHIRYSYWQSTGLRTFVTTNLKFKEVEDLYGTHIRDRRKEMFNIIPVIGESRR